MLLNPVWTKDWHNDEKRLIAGTVTLVRMSRSVNKFEGSPDFGKMFYFPWFPGTSHAHGYASEKAARAMVRRRLNGTGAI